MTVVELTDIKTTINWLLENGEFKDAETSYNIAMNSINILEEALTIHSVVVPKGTLCRNCGSDDIYNCFLTDVKVCNKCHYQD